MLMGVGRFDVLDQRRELSFLNGGVEHDQAWWKFRHHRCPPHLHGQQRYVRFLSATMPEEFTPLRV
jgi:hypothetical protein